MSVVPKPLQHIVPLQQKLAPVLSVLERLELIEAITSRQVGHNDLVDSLTHKQNVAEVLNRLGELQSPEIAHLIEMLPQTLRFFVWDLLKVELAAEVLSELQDSVVEDVLEKTSPDRLLSILSHVEPEELAELADDLKQEDLQKALQQAISQLAADERDWIRQSRSYEEDQIGDLMSMDKLTIFGTISVQDAIKELQNIEEWPDQTDKIFVINATNRLLGELPLSTLLRRQGSRLITDVMENDCIIFLDSDPIEKAITAFEHYDLVSAPVVNARGRLIGRLTVESVMDYQMERAEDKALARDGLSVDFDLFGPILEGARQRWAWLAINLITAFAASRCISLFESTITQLVALATLMPIVASIGGNTGNQTIALIIRGLVLDQITSSNLRYLVMKELAISLLNGLLWGSVLGSAAALLYQNITLGLVMASATTLTLLFAAGFGILVPLTMHKMGRDPALGSSVILTFCTDSMGFLLFLGLASLLLVK